MSRILVPQTGDFGAWPKGHEACVAVDWDGTCKDSMVPKWTRGFNLAITQVWPALRDHQRAIDEVCFAVNLSEPTAGVQRFVALKLMMQRWQAMGLPVPDLSAFFRAVEHVEQTGQKHGVDTYRKLQQQFGYDDSPLVWSDTSDRIIAQAVKGAKLFDNCRPTLQWARQCADLIVVSASKTQAVHDDLIADDMLDVFLALCAQDFLPKQQTLTGLKRRYPKVLFIGDTPQDERAATAAGVPIYLVKPGDEARSWQKARSWLEAQLKT